MKEVKKIISIVALMVLLSGVVFAELVSFNFSDQHDFEHIVLYDTDEKGCHKTALTGVDANHVEFTEEFPVKEPQMKFLANYNWFCDIEIHHNIEAVAFGYARVAGGWLRITLQKAFLTQKEVDEIRATR